MSATINAERFAAYFGGCAIEHIPGFTHPVEQFWLEVLGARNLAPLPRGGRLVWRLKPTESCQTVWQFTCDKRTVASDCVCHFK